MDEEGRSAASASLRRVTVTTPAGRAAAWVGASTSEGAALLLLHGAAGTATTWRALVDARGTADDVVALDLPGWGASGDAATVMSVTDLTDAVEAALADLGRSSWRVVGHSLGGFVALDLAARRPDVTLGAVLVSPTGVAVVDAVRRPIRGGLRLPWFAGMLLVMRFLAALGPAGRALVRGLRRAGLLPLLAAPLFAGRVDRAATDALADEIRPRSFVRACRYAGAYDLARWRAVTAPVRSVRGERDVFVGAADAAHFRALVPTFRERRLADAGHFAHVERPDAVLAALAEVGG